MRTNYADWNQSVNVWKLIELEDSQNLVKYPNNGRIEETWGAKRDGVAVLVGPRDPECSRYGTHGYLAETKLCISSLRELEKLATTQGLKIFLAEEWDLDGILEQHYRFINPELEKQRREKRQVEEEKRKASEAQRRNAERVFARLPALEKVRSYSQSQLRSRKIIGILCDAAKQYFEQVKGLESLDAENAAAEFAWREHNKKRCLFQEDLERAYKLFGLRIAQYAEARWDNPNLNALNLSFSLSDSINSVRTTKQ